MTAELDHQKRPGRTYLNVALCVGEAGRWPRGTSNHVVTAVNLPHHPEHGVVNHEDHTEEFAAALAVGESVILIARRPAADRPLFGQLLATGDLLSRSHPGHGPMRRVALVDRAEPNMGWVFNQEGIDIEFVGSPNRRGGPAQRGRPFPSSREDWSIVRWWREHPRTGLLWAEMTLGRRGPGCWSPSGASRAIDAVHFPGHAHQRADLWSGEQVEVAELVHDSEVEIVEAKKQLNLDVIGQCLAGIIMFARSYPHHGPLTPFAVVRGNPDPALAWVCHRRGIRLASYDEEEIRELQHRGGTP